MLGRCTCSILIVLAVLPGPQDPSPDPDRPEQRVIVHVNRHLEVAGFVVLEDEDVIILRSRDARLESHAKARLLKIVRLVEPKPGQTGVVILRNGQQRAGVILDDAFDHVLLDINGIQAKLPRSTVDHVILEPTFEERYRQYKAALNANVPQQHLELCRWLVSERRYELARRELEDLLAREPLPDARRLLTVVEAQLALQAEAPPAEPRAAPRRPVEGAEGARTRILTHSDVNLIRVYEIDFDRPPKVSVEPETIARMIERYGTNRLIPAARADRRALYTAEPLEIVELLFKLRARDLYPEISVLTEPWALNLFRRRVHNTWLLNGCSTSRCHGGPAAGRFFLHRSHFKDERVRYTNLLILEQLEIDPDWILVNYDEPMMSLIIQYGLPRTKARKPHPDVKGWRPVFGPGGKRMLRDTVAWVESMMQPRPAYPVEFEIPDPADSESRPPLILDPDLDRAPR